MVTSQEVILNLAQTRWVGYLLAPETTVLNQIVSQDDLERLQYAHEQGCSLDSETCFNVARKGHLECLRYAHEQG